MEDFVYGIKTRKYLMDAYGYIAAMAVDSGISLIRCLVQAIDDLNFDAEFDVIDIQREVYFLRASIEALEMLGSSAAEFNSDPATLKTVCSALVTLGRKARLAKFSPERQKVARAFNKIKRSSLEFEAADKANTAKKRQLRLRIVESEAAKLKR